MNIKFLGSQGMQLCFFIVKMDQMQIILTVNHNKEKF